MSILCLPNLATCDKLSKVFLLGIYILEEIKSGAGKDLGTRLRTLVGPILKPLVSPILKPLVGPIPNYSNPIHFQTTGWSHSKLEQPYSKITTFKPLVGPIPRLLTQCLAPLQAVALSLPLWLHIGAKGQ